MLKKIDIYKIIIEPQHSVDWDGIFNFKPNSEDVAAAIRKDIEELDPEDEYENDKIQNLRKTLELVTFQTPELLGEVKIAGTLVGEISIAIIKVFAREQQSMPAMSFRDSHLDGTGYILRNNPCEEIPLDDSVQRRDCMGPTEKDS